MLLADDVEVFVVKANGVNDFRTEYKRNASPQQPYIAVKNGEVYSIAVVFGKDFEITPPTANLALDRRVSACRIKIDIDGGLALTQRIFRMPDTEKRPKVQEFSIFDTAAFGGVTPCELQFVKIPTDHPNGFEMTKKLLYQTSHIDIEFERGYLDFFDDAEPPRPYGNAGLCDPRLISKDNKRERFRTKFLRSKKQEPAALNRGKFVSREAIKQMKINYGPEEDLQNSCETGNLVLAAHSEAQMACITALERYVQLRGQRRQALSSNLQLLSSAKANVVERPGTPIKTPTKSTQGSPESASKGPRSSGVKPSKSLRNAPKAKASPKIDDSPTVTKTRKKAEIPKPVPPKKLKEFSKSRQGGGLLQASQVEPSIGNQEVPSTPQQSQASKKQKPPETPTYKHAAAIMLKKAEQSQQKPTTPKSAKRKRVEVDLTLVSDEESSDGRDSDDEEIAMSPRTKKPKRVHEKNEVQIQATTSSAFKELPETERLAPAEKPAQLETPRHARAQTEAPASTGIRMNIDMEKPFEIQKSNEVQKPAVLEKHPEVQPNNEPAAPDKRNELLIEENNNLNNTTSSGREPFDWRKTQEQLRRFRSMPPEPVPAPAVQDTKAEEKAKRKRAKEEANVEKARRAFAAIEKARAEPENEQQRQEVQENVVAPTANKTAVDAIHDLPVTGQGNDPATSEHTTAPSTTTLPASPACGPTTPSLSISQGGSAFVRRLGVPPPGLDKAPPSVVAGWKNLKDLVHQIESQQVPTVTAAAAPPSNSTTLIPIDHSTRSTALSGNSPPRRDSAMHMLNDANVKLSIAKHEYEILAAESDGRGDSVEVIKQKIEAVKCKIELGKREIERLEGRLVG